MFGYVIANTDSLSEEDKKRYKSMYCGLCWTLKDRHGEFSRISINYDMTFLAIMLSSVYHPEEENGSKRCFVHPLKISRYTRSPVLDYVADMDVLLAIYSCLDGWNDDRNVAMLTTYKMLLPQKEEICKNWPRQGNAVEYCINRLTELEKNGTHDPDKAADCFGSLLGEIFVWKDNDKYAPMLREFGRYLGEFIYTMDAFCDYEEDKKKNRYNAFSEIVENGGDQEAILTMLISTATDIFERMHLKYDYELMKNILYSGVWTKWRQKGKKLAAV
ncbi:MAG: DUF5685 family protein [Oscillospiraceae bacterium]|jgi:hypothetical protein